MTNTYAVLSMLVVAALLAGCADDPPAGTFTLAPGPLSADGTVEIAYQEFQDPLGQASGPDDQLCTLRPPEAGLSCTPPRSSFAVGFPDTSLPAPDPAAPYKAFFVGTAQELEIGALQQSNGTYGVVKMFEQFLGDDPGATVEVRMGGVLIATAPATEGIQTFAPATGIRQLTGEGSFDGKQFQVQVSGVPRNATLVGWFVVQTEEAGADHVVSFPITEGENTYTAEQNIAAYDAFHIHLGGSKINLAIADLEA